MMIGPKMPDTDLHSVAFHPMFQEVLFLLQNPTLQL